MSLYFVSRYASWVSTLIGTGQSVFIAQSIETGQTSNAMLFTS